MGKNQAHKVGALHGPKQEDRVSDVAGLPVFLTFKGTKHKPELFNSLNMSH